MWKNKERLKKLTFNGYVQLVQCNLRPQIKNRLKGCHRNCSDSENFRFKKGVQIRNFRSWIIMSYMDRVLLVVFALQDKSLSTSVVQQKAATLFRSKVPEVCCGRPNLVEYNDRFFLRVGEFILEINLKQFPPTPPRKKQHRLFSLSKTKSGNFYFYNGRPNQNHDNRGNESNVQQKQGGNTSVQNTSCRHEKLFKNQKDTTVYCTGRKRQKEKKRKEKKDRVSNL